MSGRRFHETRTRPMNGGASAESGSLPGSTRQKRRALATVMKKPRPPETGVELEDTNDARVGADPGDAKDAS